MTLRQVDGGFLVCATCGAKGGGAMRLRCPRGAAVCRGRLHAPEQTGEMPPAALETGVLGWAPESVRGPADADPTGGRSSEGPPALAPESLPAVAEGGVDADAFAHETGEAIALEVGHDFAHAGIVSGGRDDEESSE